MFAAKEALFVPQHKNKNNVKNISKPKVKENLTGTQKGDLGEGDLMMARKAKKKSDSDRIRTCATEVISLLIRG